jgi:hypothetical protein
MRKLYFILLILFMGVSATAQTQYLGTQQGSVISRGVFSADSLYRLPIRDTVFPIWYLGMPKQGAMIMRSSDSLVYVYNGKKWNTSGNSGVQSIATNTSTGVTGGTITSSGTIAIDTTIISTRRWRQKGIDSLQANINSKLNISDTANIRFRPVAGSNITLSGTYPTITISSSSGGGSTDTTSLSNRINSKLNIVDTANIRFRPIAGTNITLSGTYPNITINESRWTTDSISAIYVGPSLSSYSSTNTGLLNFPDANGTATSGISFGGTGGTNLNIYRPNISYLRTDGGFLVGTTFYVGNTSNKWTLAGGAEIIPSTISSGASSALTINQTWNTTGNPTLITANVTNTQSGTSSNLFNLQVNSTSRFRVDKNAVVTINNSSQIISGSGTPEGTISAPVGSMYLRTDGGAGTTLYIKETGTGATGWTAK